jgi:hypothetical protein
MADSENTVGGVNVEVSADLTRFASGLQAARAQTQQFDREAATAMGNVARATEGLTASQRSLVAAVTSGKMSLAELSAYLGKSADATKTLAAAQAALAVETKGAAAATVPLAVGVKAADVAMGGMKIQTALATRELVVMGREIARGNFSRLAGSATILAQSMGVLAFAFTPVGIAVIGLTAGLAIATIATLNFEAAQAKLARTMETTGRVSGLTTAQVKSFATEAAAASGQSPNVAATSAGAYASAGVQSPEVLKNLIRVTQEYADLTGQKVPAAQKELAASMAEPTKAGEKLLGTWGELDSATKRQIETLTAYGRTEEAQEVIARKMVGTLDDTTRAGGYTKSAMEKVGSAFDQMGQSIGHATGAMDKLIGSTMHWLAVSAGLAKHDAAIGAEAAQQAKDARNAALVKIENRADEAPGTETPEDRDRQREQELKGGAAQKNLAMGAAKILGDAEGVRRYKQERDSLNDTISRNTDAQGRWISSLDREHMVMQESAKLAAARHSHNLQAAKDAEDRITLLKAGDTVETNAQARQHAADEAALTGAHGVGRGKKDMFGPQDASKEADAQAEVALAEAYLQSGTAAAKAEASRKALTEATLKGRSAAQTAKLVQAELNLETGKAAAEGAKKVAELRAESDAWDRANEALAKGTIGRNELDRSVTESIEIGKLEALADAANTKTKAELLKVIKELKAAYDASDTSKDQSVIARQIDETRDKIEDMKAEMAAIGQPKGQAAIGTAQRTAQRTLKDQGVDPSSAMGQQFVGGQVDEAKVKNALEAAQAVDKLVKSTKEEIVVLGQEGQTYGMTKQAAATFVEYHKLLNDAQKEGIQLDEKERAALANVAAAYGQAEVASKKLTDAQKGAQQASQSLADTFSKGIEGMIYDGDKLNVTLRSMSQQIGKQTLDAVLTGSGPFAQILGTSQNAAGGPGGIMNALTGSLFGVPGSMGNKPDGTAANPLNVVMAGGAGGMGGGLLGGMGGGSSGGIMGMLSSLFGGGGGSSGIAGGLGASEDMMAFLHTGTSYVGTPGRQVRADPGLFIDAPRLHSGLAPDEFPAILQRGERVTPRGGGGNSGVRDVHIHVSSPDTTSFARTGSQIARNTKREMASTR